MNSKAYSSPSKDNISDPSSRKYAEKVKNKANEKTPSGEDEPTTGTHYR